MVQNNAYAKQSSYDKVPQPGNPTYTEAWALVEAARRMAGPIEFGTIDDATNLTALRDALRLNWRLWTIFQAELSLEDGVVPDEIRGNMLSLCNFVDKHSVEAINEPTIERVLTLIEINREIANGLLESLQKSEDILDAQISDANSQESPHPEPLTSINTDV